jgi:hypothetical protein
MAKKRGNSPRSAAKPVPQVDKRWPALDTWLARLGFPLAVLGLLWQALTYHWDNREVIEIRPARGRDKEWTEIHSSRKQRNEPVSMFGVVMIDIVNLGRHPAYIRDVYPDEVLEALGTDTLVPAYGHRTVRIGVHKDWFEELEKRRDGVMMVVTTSRNVHRVGKIKPAYVVTPSEMSEDQLARWNRIVSERRDGK